MDLFVFLKGLAIGYAMAVPPGPAGVLCIRKTLASGRRDGMSIGLGAATADMMLASVAAFGVAFVSDLIVREQLWLRIGGGTLLFALGIRLFLVQQKDPVVPFLEKTWIGSYVSVILLGLTNPMTVFSFFAVFAIFGLGQSMTLLNGCVVVSGIFAGSSLWFLTLSYLATSFRGRLESGGFQWVNRFAAFLIIACGVAAFVSVL
jgi:threonine/homoserine/homoserine lactone efflux protein